MQWLINTADKPARFTVSWKMTAMKKSRYRISGSGFDVCISNGIRFVQCETKKIIFAA